MHNIDEIYKALGMMAQKRNIEYFQQNTRLISFIIYEIYLLALYATPYCCGVSDTRTILYTLKTQLFDLQAVCILYIAATS